MTLRFMYGGVTALVIVSTWVMAMGMGAQVATNESINYAEPREEITTAVEDATENATQNMSTVGRLAYNGLAGPALFAVDYPIGYAYDLGYRLPWLGKSLLTIWPYLMYGGIIATLAVSFNWVFGYV